MIDFVRKNRRVVLFLLSLGALTSIVVGFIRKISQ